MKSSFRNMAAHQRAFALANDLHDDIVNWPSFEMWTIGVQLQRSADSVHANIAEALGHWHGGERRRLLYIARASMTETESWLLAAEHRQLLPRGTHGRLDDIARPLSGLIRRATPR